VLGDPKQESRPEVGKYTMIFSAFSNADYGAVGDSGNSKYSDIMKQYAINVLKASMASPHGNTTAPLRKKYYSNIAEMSAIGDKFTFMGELQNENEAGLGDKSFNS